MNDEQEKRPKLPLNKLIGILVALAVLSPELLGLVILGFAVYAVVKAVKAQPKKPAKALDDCPKPICFHKDKGEHHLPRGKEIDPWDRPDIDISKYQRKE